MASQKPSFSSPETKVHGVISIFANKPLFIDLVNFPPETPTTPVSSWTLKEIVTLASLRVTFTVLGVMLGSDIEGALLSELSLITLSSVSKNELYPWLPQLSDQKPETIYQLLVGVEGVNVIEDSHIPSVASPDTSTHGEIDF